MEATQSDVVPNSGAERSSDSSMDISVPPRSDDSVKTLKTARRKADLRLVAWYSLVYFFLTMQVHNTANAAIMNVDKKTDIQHQLGDLTSEQWATMLNAAHASDMLFEPFAAFLLKEFSPRKWIGTIMLVWGVIAMCNGVVRNYAGLVACQFFLGLAQAGFFPGMMYHLSFWYPTPKMSLCVAIITTAGIISGAVSGLLAFGISNLDGYGGLAGWRWLFILEGAPTVIFGLCSLFFLPNFPDDATFLTETERQSVITALPATQPSSKDKTWDWKQIKNLLKDHTTYTFCLIWAFHAIGSDGIKTALPNVMLGLGMTHTHITQLLTMPIYLLGACCLMLTAWLIRGKKLDSWIAAFGLEVTCCACYVVLITVQHPAVRYVFILLASTTSVGVLSILWPERIRAAQGTSTTAFAIGLTSAASLLHGIVGPHVWQRKFGPSYRISSAVSLGLLVCVVIAMVTTWLTVKRRDKKNPSNGAEKERNEGSRHDSFVWSC